MATAALKRRKELRSELALIEKQIYDLESTYLEETRSFGNVFVGWDGYFNPNQTRDQTTRGKNKKTITNEERFFSLSSMTSPASKKEDIIAAKELAKEKEEREKKGDKVDDEKLNSRKRKNIDEHFLEGIEVEL